VTSATFPASSPRWGDGYSEGGNEVSLPYAGASRAVLVRQNGGAWWLVDGNLERDGQIGVDPGQVDRPVRPARPGASRAPASRRARGPPDV